MQFFVTIFNSALTNFCTILEDGINKRLSEVFNHSELVVL